MGFVVQENGKELVICDSVEGEKRICHQVYHGLTGEYFAHGRAGRSWFLWLGANIGVEIFGGGGRGRGRAKEGC